MSKSTRIDNLTTHTTGPWRQMDVHPDVWTRQIWTDESHGSVMIAECGGIDKEANAKMIALSPEMLQALEELVAERSAGGYHEHLGDTYGLELARAVLGKL